MFVPAKTPVRFVSRLNQGVNKVLENADTIKLLVDFSADPIGRTSDAAADFVKSDVVRMTKLLKALVQPFSSEY